MIDTRLRLGGLDAARGLAALAVLLQHSLEAAGLQVVGQPGFGFTWLNCGEVGVVTFFLVSGFVIPLSLEKTGSLRNFWTNRAFRIYPLYGLAFAASAVFLDSPLTWKSSLAHLFFLQDYVHVKNIVAGSWTLSVECIWYIGFALAFRIGCAGNTRLLGIATVLLLMGGGLITLYGHRLPMGRLGLLASCVAGLFAYRFERGQFKRLGLGWIVAIFVAILFGNFAAFSVLPSASSDSPSFRCVAISWTSGYLLFLSSFIFLARSRFAAQITFLGRISFSVYMLHPFAIRLADLFGLTGWSLLAWVVGVTIPVSFVTYKWVESPMISLSHRLIERSSRSTPAKLKTTAELT